MIRTICVGAFVCLGLAGCGSSPRYSPEASTITYTLPETHVKIDAVLTLKDCDGMIADADVTITPLAKASDPSTELRFSLSGSGLTSFWDSRDVKLDLYPNGTIKSLNATSNDKTPAIIAGAIKLAASVALAGVSIQQSDRYTCNYYTDKALEHKKSLKREMAKLRKETVTSKDPKALGEQVNALAQEIARLETGELQIKLSETVEIGRKIGATGKYMEGGIIEWDAEKFARWTDKACLEDDKDCEGWKPAVVASTPQDKTEGTTVDPDPLDSASQITPTLTLKPFSIGYCIASFDAPIKNECTDGNPDVWGKFGAARAESVECRKWRDPEKKDEPPVQDCPVTMVLRGPGMANIMVTALSDHYGEKKNTVLKSGVINVPQWGGFEYFDLSASFGQSKTLSLSLDEFGRKTSFGWISNASGEGIVSGLNTVGDSYNTYRTTRDGEDLAELKARLDELDTIKKLNALENCKAILDAGGFVCPES